MHRSLTAGRATARAAVGLSLATLVLTAGADRVGPVAVPAVADAVSVPEIVAQSARDIGRDGVAWFRRTPPADRITWGGLAACAGLGLGVMLERLVRLRSGRIVPRDFVMRYRDRLQEGKLDRG